MSEATLQHVMTRSRTSPPRREGRCIDCIRGEPYPLSMRHPYQEGDIGAHEAMQPRRELGNFLFVEGMRKRLEEHGVVQPPGTVWGLTPRGK